jgi:hypothetical protein
VEIQEKKRIDILGSKWSFDDLIKIFDESNDTMTLCYKTKKPLYFTKKDGRKILLDSFGVSVISKKPFHWTELNISNDAAKADCPIEYIGMVTRDEVKLPLTEKEIIEIKKEHGI